MMEIMKGVGIKVEIANDWNVGILSVCVFPNGLPASWEKFIRFCEVFFGLFEKCEMVLVLNASYKKDSHVTNN